MSMENHALSQAKLGNFIGHEVFNAANPGHPADWQCAFHYDNGTVVQSKGMHNQQYQYRTEMLGDIPTQWGMRL